MQRGSTTEQSAFRRHIDQAMPGQHTRALYDCLSKKDASVLAQLRTGKYRLNHHLFRISAVESEMCPYGRESETVRHFLFRCPHWSITRDELQVTTISRWGEHTYCVGAWSDRRRPNG